MGLFDEFKGDTIGAITPANDYDTFRASINNRVILKIYALTAGTVAYKAEADGASTTHTITMSAESIFYARMTQILDTGTTAGGIVGLD